MNRKGFTLVEVLAVIAILAIILVIAVPKIGEVLSISKEGTFKTNVDEIMKIVKLHYQENYGASLSNNIITYAIENNKITQNNEDLKLSSKTGNLNGTIQIDSNGKTKLVLKDNEYCALKKFNGVVSMHNLKDNSNCNLNMKICTYNGELVDGAEFIDGQYTYNYITSYGGWGVELSDKTATTPVTTKLCTIINNKPIVDMSYMFYGSKATSIDLSSFDTSNVKDMNCMFYRSAATSLDLSSFDTSNVIYMNYMFYNSAATIGYARTQADANKFNASSGKPSTLTFVVK